MRSRQGILCNCGIVLSKFGCHGNSLGSLENLDGIFEIAHPENLAICVKKSSIFLRRTEMGAIFCLLLPKFGCHGNVLCYLETLDSIFEIADPENPTIHAKMDHNLETVPDRR